MTGPEREAAALAEIQACLERHRCRLCVQARPGAVTQLPDGSVMAGTQYLVAVQALPDGAEGNANEAVG